MTSNQIALNAYMETQRHNKASEDIERTKASAQMRSAGASEMSSRAALQQAGIAALRQSEDARHNLVEEYVKQGQLRVQEGTLQETQRHQRAQESLTKYSADVSAAASRYASDNAMAVGMRNAAVNYSVGMAGASASMAHAQAALKQAAVSAAAQSETARHNLVQEYIDSNRAESYAKQAAAASSQADTAKYLSGSQKFKNVTSGIQDITKSIGNVVDTVGSAGSLLALLLK